MSKDIDIQKEIFSNNLKYYINKFNKSQKEIADTINVSAQTFNTWVQGIAMPRMPKIQALAKYFHIDITDLINEHKSIEHDYYISQFLNTDDNFIKSLVKAYMKLDFMGKQYIQDLFYNIMKNIQLCTAPTSTTKTIPMYITHTHSMPPDNAEASYKQTQRIIPYYYGASAGTGIYHLKSEYSEQIEIPDIPEYKNISYAVKVNGDSMIPTYLDGETALVSRDELPDIGEIGIFVVDSEIFIKERGEDRLISHNPKYKDIIISECSNIVCEGKVIGKL